MRQGCSLSPTLFNLYIEEGLKDLGYEKIEGIEVNGMLVQVLCFADDITMIADSEENIERILQKIDNTLKQNYNMQINKTKKKILICSRQ